MATAYREWVRQNLLREEPGPILSESVLQRIWFEQLIRDPLHTLEGEKITLHHPGIWNHRAGPDFLGASFATAGGRTLGGDVELHRHPSDWQAHGHATDPAYRGVRLHVFWQNDPAMPGSPTPGIRQIALEHQLAAPLSELIPLFRSSPAELRTGEKPGHCHPLLLSLPPAQLQEILEEAGWHRLRRRRALAQARISSLGFDQAVWVALAEGLGFSENREIFGALARAVPIRRLLPVAASADRAAILHGAGGLLPDPTCFKVCSRALPVIRELWDRWWNLRGTWESSVLISPGWRFGSARPHNAPSRRLAALVGLSDPVVWRAFRASVAEGRADSFCQILRSVSDPFWDHHASWEGRPLSRPARLVGTDRAAALLFQVLAPLARLSERELGRRMATCPAGGDAGLLRSASVRLLGVPFPPPDVRTHLAREGLLQIYRDFCRTRPCGDCGMPAFLAARRTEAARPLPS